MGNRRIIVAMLWAAIAWPSSAPAELMVQVARGKPPAVAPAPDSAQADLAEYLARKSKLKSDDVEARLDLAKWCRDREMWQQMGEMSKEALDLDPENRVAYLFLKLRDERMPIERNEKSESALLDELKKRFGRDFSIYASRHFLIAYDTPKEFAVSRGAALEKAYDSFLFYFNMRKLRPAILNERLVVILITERNDYLKYAREVDGADLGWSAGYYSQRTNRSAFYDDSSGPAAEKAEKDVEAARERVKELSAQISTARTRGQRGLATQLTAERNKWNTLIAQHMLRVDNAVGVLNNVKTVHEAAHQLAFNTGVQKRLVDYPLWFSEGLACAFEVEDRNGNRGPSVYNWGRVAIVKDAIKSGKLVPLEKFITQSSPEEMEESTLSIWYAQGWALFHYMYKFHRPELELYLTGFLETPPLRELTAEKRLKLFTDAFGKDVAGFDKKFTTYLNSLPNAPK